MLPLLYEFPEAMQTDRSKPWADPQHWPMVMPNLGRSLHLDTMIAGYRAAKEKGEEEERRWASQPLNIEIGLALQSDNWVGADFWAASPVRVSSLAEAKKLVGLLSAESPEAQRRVMAQCIFQRKARPIRLPVTSTRRP